MPALEPQPTAIEPPAVIKDQIFKVGDWCAYTLNNGVCCGASAKHRVHHFCLQMVCRHVVPGSTHLFEKAPDGILKPTWFWATCVCGRTDKAPVGTPEPVGLDFTWNHVCDPTWLKSEVLRLRQGLTELLGSVTKGIQ